MYNGGKIKTWAGAPHNRIMCWTVTECRVTVIGCVGLVCFLYKQNRWPFNQMHCLLHCKLIPYCIATAPSSYCGRLPLVLCITVWWEILVGENFCKNLWIGIFAEKLNFARVKSPSIYKHRAIYPKAKCSQGIFRKICKHLLQQNFPLYGMYYDLFPKPPHKSHAIFKCTKPFR